MNKQKAIGYVLVAAIAVVTLTGALIVRSFSATDESPFGRRPVSVWKGEPNAVAEVGQATFGIKAALVVPEEILLFYATGSSGSNIGKVRASFGSGGATNEASIQTQTLGSETGLIRIPWTNRPGQSLSLTVAQADSDPNAAVWQVNPLKQVVADPGRGSVQWISFQNGPSEVEVVADRIGGTDAALVRIVGTASAAKQTYLRIDRNGGAEYLPEGEYTKLLGASSSLPRDSGAATPAPMQP